MEEEQFMFSFIAALIGVLPILFLSIIVCEKKKPRKTQSSKQNLSKNVQKRSKSKRKTSRSKSKRKLSESKQKPSSTSRKKLSISGRKTPASKLNKCAECERFDAQVDAAINSRSGVSISNTNGRCIINGYEITPKTCEHGNGRDIVIDRLGLHMNAHGGMSIGDGILIGCSYNKVTVGNVTMRNGNRYKGSTTKANECSECQRYDKEVAAASKASVTRDYQGNMVITGSPGMNVVNQNGQTYVNGHEIQRRNCHHNGLCGCVVYNSSNLYGINDSIYHNCSNVNANDCVIRDSKNINGNDCTIYKSSHIRGNDCTIYKSCDIRGNDNKIYNSSRIHGNDCKIYNSSYINGNDNTVYNSSYVTGNDCTFYSCSHVAGNDNVVY